MVAAVVLPPFDAKLLNTREDGVAQSGTGVCLSSDFFGPEHGILTRRNQRLALPLFKLAVGFRCIIGAIKGGSFQGIGNGIEEFPRNLAVMYVARRALDCDDLEGVDVDGNVALYPRSALAYSVLAN
jgi:hypothetical protein